MSVPARLGENNLQEQIRVRARSTPNALAYSFLVDGDRQAQYLTFHELDLAARNRASELLSRGLQGRTVLLSYNAGPEFQIAFLACTYAGVIAVPVPVPQRPPGLRRLRHIAQNAQTLTVLSDIRTRDLVGSCLGGEADNGLVWIETDRLEPADVEWRYRDIADDDIAFLQYTSGSTGDPKGVMVTHANLRHQVSELDELWPGSPGGSIVSWLPMFHDMGLLFGLILPIFTGMPAHLMSPEAFVRKPLRWLEAISRHRATHAIAPNFAYERCVSHIQESQLDTLDLSTWRFALSGAEPVRTQTLHRFAAAFARCGLSPDALTTGYGLAENTLKVSGSPVGTMAQTLWLSATALQNGRAEIAEEGESGIPVVNCGRSQGDTRIRIINPRTRESLPAGRVGEIWVTGSSVAKGYWNNPEETAATFRARVAGEAGDEEYLRTGDLGFLHEGQLYVTGRWKDLLVLNGNNHYPQDIEHTAEQSHPLLRTSSTCTFSIEHDDQEQLVVVVEADGALMDRTGPTEVADVISAAIWREHELRIHDLVLIRRGTLPRTTSGKIQRGGCRRLYLDDRLQWANTPEDTTKLNELLAWLRDWGRRRVNSRLMDERRCIPPHIVLDLGRKGLLGMEVPRSYGGLGLDSRSTLRVIEQLAAIDLSLATFVCDHNALGVHPILRYGSEDLRTRLLPELASGRMLTAFAVTEPGAGSAIRSISAAARETGPGQWQITGDKSWSGTSAWADVIVTFVQLRDATDRLVGMTGFAVPGDLNGVQVGQEALTMGLRSMVHNSLRFEDVPVTAEHLLGTPGGGMEVAGETMMRTRLLIGALALGAMKRCLQLQLRYVQRREISTGRLLDNPVTLGRMSEATAAADAVEALLYGSAELLDKGYRVPDELFLAAKMLSTELLWETIDQAMQSVGGRGYIEPNVFPQIMRDARVLRIFEGPTESLRAHLGSAVAAGSPELTRLLTGHCAAPDLAAKLVETAPMVMSRCDRSLDSLVPTDRVRVAHELLGQLAAVTVLVGMTRRQADRDSGYLNALAWAEEKFEAVHTDATSGRLRTYIPAAQITATIDRYKSSIGIVDQHSVGADIELDAMLGESYTEIITSTTAPDSAVNSDWLKQWLTDWVARHAGLSAATVDGDTVLQSYGLDSIAVTTLIGDLLDERGVSIPSVLVWQFPTIHQLVREIQRFEHLSAS